MAASSSSSSGCEFIHEGILFQILIRLPVSSLLRFKSVCKSWLSLIESSDFIFQHTDRSNLEANQENKLVCLRPDRVISVIDLQLSNQVDFKLKSEGYFSDETLIGSFNGIICLPYLLLYGGWVKDGRVVEDASVPVDGTLVEYLEVVSLWNPATKHVKILPTPSDTRLITSPDTGEYLPHYGFGFDNKTKDYRVVRVIPDLTLNRQVEVYSLNTDSWRVINAVVPLSIKLHSTPKRPFRRNDVFYWSGWENISKYPVILSFDFSNEVFGTIPMDAVFGIIPGPPACRLDHIIASLRERLACIHWNYDPSSLSKNFKIWMLDTCGVKESWTKLYTVILDPLVCPLGFSVNGNMVSRKGGYISELLLFDPSRQEFIDTPFKDIFSKVAVYKESLVSVKGGNGENYGKDFSLIEFN